MTKRIVIGIDIRDLRVAKTGQKTTLEELYLQFRSMKQEGVTFFFFDSILPIYTGRNKILLTLGHIQYHFWKQVTLPLKAWLKSCDIIFCADYFVPYVHLGFKTVQVFHDAFFYEYPEHYNRLWHYIFKYIGIPAARKSTFIIVPTNYAREKIHFYTHFPKEKFITIYEGPKTLKINGYENKPAWFKKLEKQKYILHVGVMEKRKNLPMLIRSFRKLIDDGYEGFKLVLVGKGNGILNSDDSGQVYKAIHENSLEQHVILLGYLSDEELGLAYSNAFMYVFPSYNEGFGIPILEAFRFGLPVLVANNTCLPEVGGDAVITFNPFDVTEIYEKMKLVIENEPLRQKLKKDGLKRGLEFSWEKAADNIVTVFKRSVSNKPV